MKRKNFMKLSAIAIAVALLAGLLPLTMGPPDASASFDREVDLARHYGAVWAMAGNTSTTNTGNALNIVDGNPGTTWALHNSQVARFGVDIGENRSASRIVLDLSKSTNGGEFNIRWGTDSLTRANFTNHGDPTGAWTGRIEKQNNNSNVVNHSGGATVDWSNSENSITGVMTINLPAGTMLRYVRVEVTPFSDPAPTIHALNIWGSDGQPEGYPLPVAGPDWAKEDGVTYLGTHNGTSWQTTTLPWTSGSNDQSRLFGVNLGQKREVRAIRVTLNGTPNAGMYLGASENTALSGTTPNGNSSAVPTGYNNLALGNAAEDSQRINSNQGFADGYSQMLYFPPGELMQYIRLSFYQNQVTVTNIEVYGMAVDPPPPAATTWRIQYWNVNTNSQQGALSAPIASNVGFVIRYSSSTGAVNPNVNIPAGYAADSEAMYSVITLTDDLEANILRVPVRELTTWTIRYSTTGTDTVGAVQGPYNGAVGDTIGETNPNIGTGLDTTTYMLNSSYPPSLLLTSTASANVLVVRVLLRASTLRGIDLARGQVNYAAANPFGTGINGWGGANTNLSENAAGWPAGHDTVGRTGQRSWASSSQHDTSAGSQWYRPNLAFDGLTYWSGNNSANRRYWESADSDIPNGTAPAVLGVDLGNVYALDEITLKIPQYGNTPMTNGNPWGARTQSIAIQTSTVAGGWNNITPGSGDYTTVIPRRDFIFGGSVNDNAVTVKVPLNGSSLREARYVRLLIYLNRECWGPSDRKNNNAQIAAFEVYGEDTSNPSSIADFVYERTNRKIPTSDSVPAVTNNIAQGKPIWVNSSHEGSTTSSTLSQANSLRFIVDNNLTGPDPGGWWTPDGTLNSDRSQSRPDIITIDLRDEYQFKGLGFYGLDRMGQVTLRMRVWGSTDGAINQAGGSLNAATPGTVMLKNWSNYTFVANPTYNFRHFVDLASNTAYTRYLHIEIAGKAKDSFSTAIDTKADGILHLAEIQVFANEGHRRAKNAPAAITGGIAITSATASSTLTGTAANNVLVNNNTIWEGNGSPPSSLTLNLGSATTIGAVTIRRPSQVAVAYANYPKSTMNVEVRNGGATGATLGSGTLTFDPYTGGNQATLTIPAPGNTVTTSQITLRFTSYSESVVNQINSSQARAFTRGVIFNAPNVDAQVSEVIVEPALPKYAVTYNGNGHTGGTVPAPQEKIHDTDLTLHSGTPTKTGFTFQGWSLSADATAATWGSGGIYTLNEANTLYAVWVPVLPADHTITYNANGGALGTVPATVTVTDGGSHTVL
ncbi:MAG: InlB B-repeat-containing protein, partial [Oscillospiraceae bacterium]|nr:InlB B-repeat-containing protein [Oscillospiraceae bacterium]